MANLQTNEQKQYFIPLELTPGTVIPEKYKDCEVRWVKIGRRMVRAILIPATKEQYYAYMRPLWREDKRQQRHGADEVSIDKARDDYELEVAGDFDLEGTVMKKELYRALHQNLDALQDIDRTILQMVANGFSEMKISKVVGRSQKGVNKRKNKVCASFRDCLKDYR